MGWLAMLRGYWTSKWQIVYERTYTIPDAETPKDRLKGLQQMTRWQSKVIQMTWRILIPFWKLRNDEHHGWDKESHDIAKREVLHKEPEAIYHKKHQYPLRVQRLL
jgi:hypothetical protein